MSHQTGHRHSNKPHVQPRVPFLMMEDLARIPCVQDFSNHLKTHKTHTDRQTDRQTDRERNEIYLHRVGSCRSLVCTCYRWDHQTWVDNHTDQSVDHRTRRMTQQSHSYTLHTCQSLVTTCVISQLSITHTSGHVVSLSITLTSLLITWHAVRPSRVTVTLYTHVNHSSLRVWSHSCQSLSHTHTHTHNCSNVYILGRVPLHV